MPKYRLLIKPCSPFQTPLHSDTIFGHICWALRYIKGETELIKFLHAYDDGNAPFILSSGFPKDYLPMPVLRPINLNEEEALWKIYENGNQERLEFARDIKALKKVPYIQISAVNLLKNELSYYNLYLKHLHGEILLEEPEIAQSSEVWHNAKNRITDRVVEGKLFTKQDTFYKEGAEFNVYIDNSCFERKDICEIFNFIARSGYGADKSVGRGAFDYELLDGWDFEESDNPNGFMSLSHYHPNKGNFNDGFYDISTKFGKIGGHWASGGDGGPYKMPALMLDPGSVFLTQNPKSFYGRLIPDVHKQKDVVHYGITLPLKVRAV